MLPVFAKRFLLVVAALFLPASLSAGGGGESESSAVVIRYLALGDSYTIGQSVGESERWPAQLAVSLKSDEIFDIPITYRAQTGWTTRNLLDDLERDPPTGYFDIVSLLIGVNNQYQGIDIGVYKRDVQTLISKAISFAGGAKERIFVVSIPDYAYSPFGARLSDAARRRISEEIDAYNVWMRDYCAKQQIPFVDITGITREGLTNTSLVATDGLHPSGAAYALFVDEIRKIVDLMQQGILHRTDLYRYNLDNYYTTP